MSICFAIAEQKLTFHSSKVKCARISSRRTKSYPRRACKLQRVGKNDARFIEKLSVLTQDEIRSGTVGKFTSVQDICCAPRNLGPERAFIIMPASCPCKMLAVSALISQLYRKH